MKIGKQTQPRTGISTSDEKSITVRGHDLCRDLVGKMSFTAYFYLLLTGSAPSPAQAAVLDACLVAIAEHGLVPSVVASRMTLAAAPDAMQGAVAAGLLGCGSVILGAAQDAGQLLLEIEARTAAEGSAAQATRTVLAEWRAAARAIPGYGHPLHKDGDPRVMRLFEVAREQGTNLRYIELAQAVEDEIESVIGKPLKLNVSAAIPAVLLGAGFPAEALRGVPLLARTAGLIAHLVEEIKNPIGFALAYQAARDAQYSGDVREV
jgi:citrate synthase